MKADEDKKKQMSNDYYKEIYDYINSEKETEPKADNKTYYIDRKDFNDFKSYIHFDELKEYLEKNKDKLSIESVKNFYVEKKLDIKRLENEKTVEIIEKDDKAANNNQKEEINEKFKELLNIFGYVTKKEEKESTDKKDINEAQKEKNKEINKKEDNKEEKKIKGEQEDKKEIKKEDESNDAKNEIKKEKEQKKLNNNLIKMKK